MAVTSQLPALSRTIFHVDMDAFFVSVEELLDDMIEPQDASSGSGGGLGLVSLLEHGLDASHAENLKGSAVFKCSPTRTLGI